MRAHPELPRSSGAYRWYYADAAFGDLTLVVIFMVGSPFSPRYVRNQTRGALPVAHSAVHLAMYRDGARATWVLSEYGSASTEGGVLAIGGSHCAFLPDGVVRMELDERTPFPEGRPVRAHLTLVPSSVALAPLPLGGGHVWQPLAPRAEARLELPDEGVRMVGHGYLDTNGGPEPLGLNLHGWRWTRVHDARETRVHYELPGSEALLVRARGSATVWERVPAMSPALRRTLWGLPVPRGLPIANGAFGSARLLESSPFYARLEARGQDTHALGEVADFRRFRSPWVRWMAHFRTRVEATA